MGKQTGSRRGDEQIGSEIGKQVSVFVVTYFSEEASQGAVEGLIWQQQAHRGKE